MNEQIGKRGALWPWVIAVLAVLIFLAIGADESAPPSTIGLQPQADAQSAVDSSPSSPAQNPAPADIVASPDSQK